MNPDLPEGSGRIQKSPVTSAVDTAEQVSDSGGRAQNKIPLSGNRVDFKTRNSFAVVFPRGSSIIGLKLRSRIRRQQDRASAGREVRRIDKKLWKRRRKIEWLPRFAAIQTLTDGTLAANINGLRIQKINREPSAIATICVDPLTSAIR